MRLGGAKGFPEADTQAARELQQLMTPEQNENILGSVFQGVAGHLQEVAARDLKILFKAWSDAGIQERQFLWEALL